MTYAIINIHTNEWVQEFSDHTEASDTFLSDYVTPFRMGLPGSFPCVLIEVLETADDGDF